MLKIVSTDRTTLIPSTIVIALFKSINLARGLLVFKSNTLLYLHSIEIEFYFWHKKRGCIMQNLNFIYIMNISACLRNSGTPLRFCLYRNSEMEGRRELSDFLN